MNEELTVSEKLVRELHDRADQEGKKLIEKNFPGVLFYNTNDLVYIEDGGFGARGASGCYGVISDEVFTNGCQSSKTKVKLWSGEVWGLDEQTKAIRKATKDEVKNYLTLIAENKGFYPGVRVKDLDGRLFTFEKLIFWNLAEPLEIEYSFNISGSNMPGMVIFRRGKWATIVKEVVISKAEAEKRLNEAEPDKYYRIQ